MAAPQNVRNLIDDYDRDRRQPRSKESQSSLQAKYVHKLLKALAWDTKHLHSVTMQGGRVVREHGLQAVAANERRPPEYSLRVDGVRKCFVGIQPNQGPSNNDPATSALQLRRFTWSANLPASILCNFEELSVYSGRVRPLAGDNPDVALVSRFNYTQYEEKWNELAGLLSRGAVERGELDRAAELSKSEPVDDAFLDEIEGWRMQLARTIDAQNPKLSPRELNEAVQILIDRIIFLRICEDRGIERYGQLRSIQQRSNVHQALLEIFGRADATYNAGLFRFDRDRTGETAAGALIPRLSIGNDVLCSILRALYYPESPYEFSVISADILGQVYERFLGKEIVRRSDSSIIVEEKPELRKSGGVYYTPSHVVDAIVKSTVGSLCKDKTPDQVAKIRILDPSCGSGSFLNAAYQYLLDWHRDWYVSDGPDKHRDRVRRTAQRGFQLTLDERKRILLSSIYGVDIDAQAVEITKLSLLLKALEGESEGVRRTQLVLVRDRALPNLDGNIYCGNSLVSVDFVARANQLSIEEKAKYAPFDYASAFPEVFGSDSPGFDAVVGNPPYLSFSGRHSVGLPEPVRAYFQKNFRGFSSWPTAQSLFMERSAGYLSRRYVAFVVPEQIGHLTKYGPLRNVMLQSGGLVEVRYWGKVFKGVEAPALTFLIDKTFSGPTKIIEATNEVHEGRLSGSAPWNLSLYSTLLEKVCSGSVSIENFIADCGIMTSDRKRQVVQIQDTREGDVPVLEGRCVQRYACTPPQRAVRIIPGVRLRNNNVDQHKAAVFLIRQTANRPIVGPHCHADSFRNTLIALNEPDSWVDSRYIVALLNSSVMWFAYAQMFRAAKQEVHPQVSVEALAHLPIRALDENNPNDRAFHDELVRNVDELLELNRALAEAPESERDMIAWRIAIVDDRTDRLVFRLYGLHKDEIALLKKSLGQGESNAFRSSATVDQMSSDELWSQVETDSDDEHWRACLQELVEREDPDVAAYVAWRLEHDELAIKRRVALVIAAERSQCFESDVRSLLQNGLYKSAIILRDAGEERALWAAIRRFASLVPLNQVDELLSFLRDEDSLATKQAALQGIQSIFSTEIAGTDAAVERVRERVHVLAVQVLSRSSSVQPATSSFLLQAFVTAAVLIDPGFPELAEQFLQLSRSYLVVRACDILRSVQKAWETMDHARHRMAAIRMISDVIAKLSMSLQSDAREHGRNGAIS